MSHVTLCIIIIWMVVKTQISGLQLNWGAGGAKNLHFYMVPDAAAAAGTGTTRGELDWGTSS